MKVIQLLFVLYIISLTVQPCTEQDACKDEFKKGGQTAYLSDAGHSGHEQDVCTPFCICSCCATHIKLAPISHIDFTGVFHNTKETIPYLEKRVLSDYNHVWQPPRI